MTIGVGCGQMDGAGNGTNINGADASVKLPAVEEALPSNETDSIVGPVADATISDDGDDKPVTQPPILAWESVDGLPKQLAVFDHVFWEPDDTSTFRKMLRDKNFVRNKSVLEIGTGSGLVSLCCLHADAAQVVATDINPWAVRNASYNSGVFKFDARLNIRLVSQKHPDAWAVIGDDERYDVIFSNPPRELRKAESVVDFAFYDPGFNLMTSFLDGLPDHLNPGGRTFLAYGCVEAIRKLQQESKARNFECLIRDDRMLEDLPNLFLPGMLLEIRTTTP